MQDNDQWLGDPSIYGNDPGSGGGGNDSGSGGGGRHNRFRCGGLLAGRVPRSMHS